MPDRDLTVRLKPVEGRWSTLGLETLAGIVPEGFTCSTNDSGPDTCGFTLRRRAAVAWPDLSAFNQCEVQIGNSVVWGGRVWEAPISDTAEDSIAVQGRGWQYHLDDDMVSRYYVHTSLGDYRDQRTYAGANLANYYAGGEVQGSGEGGQMLVMANGRPVPALAHVAITLDLGAGRTAKRIVLTYQTSNNSAAIVLYVRSHSLEDSSGITGSIDDPIAGVSLNTLGASGTTAGTCTTGYRYVSCIMYWAGGGTPTADAFIKINQIKVFAATAYESGNASVLKASQVVTDVLASGALPLLDSSTASIATTSFSIPELAPQGYQTPRSLIATANAYENKLVGVDAERRLFYKTRSLTPTVEIGAWAGADFADASTNSGDGLYSKVIVQGTGPDGAQINEVRTSAVSLLTRQGFTRTAVLSVGAPMTTTSAQQLGDIWLAEKSQPPMKGTVTIMGTGGARAARGGEIHASEMLLRVGERLRLSHLVSPSGDQGRDAAIKSVSYAHDTETATVELDNERGRLEALLERLAVVTSQITI